MNVPRLGAIVLCLTLACWIGAPEARADQWNQATKLHFSQPVEVPGRVLPAGTYWFVLANSQSNRNVVEILNSTRTRVDATVTTVPTLHRYTHSRTEVILAEQGHAPDALWKWYYPGRQTGHEFVYPESEQMRLRANEKEVLITPRLS